MDTTLSDKVKELMKIADDMPREAGRSERGRLLAIINTHLETAYLYSKELEH